MKTKAKAKKDKANKVGRPVKCSAEKIARILAAIANGATKETACEKEGISRETLRRWRKKAAGNEQLYARAEEGAVEVYEDEYREVICTLIRFVRDSNLNEETRMRAAERVARMLQFLLAVNNKEKYGKSQRVELTGKDGEKLEAKADFSPALLAEVAKLQSQMEAKVRAEQDELSANLDND